MVMRLIKSFKASLMNPLGPDFKSAPWRHFNLSGSIIKFKCPPHEISSALKVAPEHIDIYKDDLFKVWSSKKGMSLELLTTGWKFWDRPFGKGAIGLTVTSIKLRRRHPHFQKVDSFFIQSAMSQWLLQYCEDMWGSLNRDTRARRNKKVRPVDPERDFWRYPQTENEIDIVNINGCNWYVILAKLPEKAVEVEWHAPISDDHDLAIIFEPSAISCEYYKQDNNIPKAVDEAINEFMSNVFVELSQEYKKRLDDMISLKNKS
ncbi:hypothetical protein EUZ85_20190 [Hahella sp. KA22]|nr:hypothetical protein ENC22_17610 [Hahella sp. KA22]QAY56295.1 hypothetical protein EUZ85_20190 [Hahella sp. KA22]